MNILRRNTNRKHIERFETLISKVLFKRMPEFTKALTLTTLDSIHFTYKPVGISIIREYEGQTEYIESQRTLKSQFELSGLKLFNKKKKKHEHVKLFFQDYTLSFIEVDQPESIHKLYELGNINLENIELNHIKITNPDREIVLNLLKGVKSETLDKLDIESTF